MNRELKDMKSLTLILLLFLAESMFQIQAVDAVVVDALGVVTMSGGAPTVSPSASEVKIGSGQIQAGGTVSAANATVSRTSPASGAEVVRGDDPRLNGGFIVLEDRKPTGTAGGGSAAATWTTHILTTESSDTTNACTLLNNQFTLAPGTYRIHGSVPFHRTGVCKARLVDTATLPNGPGTIVGTAAYTNNSGYDVSVSELDGRFTIATATQFVVQYYCQVGGSFNNLGVPVGAGEPEVYARITLVKE